MSDHDSENNLVLLPSTAPGDQPKGEPDPQLIAILEHWLSDAKAGNVECLMMQGRLHDGAEFEPGEGGVRMSTVGGDYFLMAGLAEQHAFHMRHQMFAEAWASGGPKPQPHSHEGEEPAVRMPWEVLGWTTRNTTGGAYWLTRTIDGAEHYASVRVTTGEALLWTDKGDIARTEFDTIEITDNGVALKTQLAAWANDALANAEKQPKPLAEWEQLGWHKIDVPSAYLESGSNVQPQTWMENSDGIVLSSGRYTGKVELYDPREGSAILDLGSTMFPIDRDTTDEDLLNWAAAWANLVLEGNPDITSVEVHDPLAMPGTTPPRPQAPKGD